jgi:hypothetical protein
MILVASSSVEEMANALRRNPKAAQLELNVSFGPSPFLVMRKTLTLWRGRVASQHLYHRVDWLVPKRLDLESSCRDA